MYNIRSGEYGQKGHRGLMGGPGFGIETLRMKIKRITYNTIYSIIYYKLKLHHRFKFLEKWY